MGNNRYKSVWGLVVLLLGMVLPAGAAFADTTVQTPPLAFRQIKITGDEFVIVQNTSSSDQNLAEYWLGYSSSDTATGIVPSQQLPDYTLEPGGVALLNNGSVETCDASVVANLDITSFSDTKGTLVLRHLINDGQTSSFTTVDTVTWGKLTTDNILIANESKVPAGSNVAWYKDLANPASSWQVGNYQNCTMTIVVVANIPAPAEKVVNWDSAPSSPPVILLQTIIETSESSSKIPAADYGLKALQLSEILPNPASPDTDAEDEFIELYNPNKAVFDLSGFQLQVGSTTSDTIRKYTFPDGTVIAPLSFKAFRSELTHLSLSNTGGQVWLVDPLDRTMAQSDTYGTAKDGQSWIYANGKWQWTLQSTPDATNKLQSPAVAATKVATVKNGRSVAAVKGASTTAGSSNANNVSPSTTQTVAQVTPIHPLTLVIVAVGALLYGAYEYRHDMANRLYQYRRNREARRNARV